LLARRRSSRFTRSPSRERPLLLGISGSPGHRAPGNRPRRAGAPAGALGLLRGGRPSPAVCTTARASWLAGGGGGGSLKVRRSAPSIEIGSPRMICLMPVLGQSSYLERSKWTHIFLQIWPFRIQFAIGTRRSPFWGNCDLQLRSHQIFPRGFRVLAYQSSGHSKV
jgi:hypothetical protein